MRTILIALLCASSLYAQDNFLVWPNISIEEFVSNTVDDTFKVYIKLPDGYNGSEESYPVLYLLDGDITFPTALGAVQYLDFGNYFHELIIVGIGYNTLDWRKGNMRNRDYTAMSTPERPYQGGAGKFMIFLKDELVPSIDKQYRTDTDNRILFGHSLGGQMVLYSFLNEPNMFSMYIASSPFILEVKDLLLSRLNANSDIIRNSNSKLFVSVGSEESREDYGIPVNELVKKSQVVSGSKDKVRFIEFDEESHFTVPARALVKGLLELSK